MTSLQVTHSNYCGVDTRGCTLREQRKEKCTSVQCWFIWLYQSNMCDDTLHTLHFYWQFERGLASLLLMETPILQAICEQWNDNRIRSQNSYICGAERNDFKYATFTCITWSSFRMIVCGIGIYVTFYILLLLCSLVPWNVTWCCLLVTLHGIAVSANYFLCHGF